LTRAAPIPCDAPVMTATFLSVLIVNLLYGLAYSNRTALTKIDSRRRWVSAPVPAFAAQKQMPSGLGNNEIAYASFDRTELDRLSGQLITLQPAAGLWQVRLVQADGHSLTQVAEVDENGRFAYRAKALEGFSQLPAVQIVMKLGDREARGWVHNDMLLGMSARRRLTAGALNRLMRWDAIDDDIQALLDYLSIQAEQHLDSAAIPRSGPRRFAEVSQRDFRCCLAGIPCPTPSNGMHIAVDPARLAGDRQIEEATSPGPTATGRTS